MNIQQIADKFHGRTVRDKITGFVGTAISTVGYLTGCTQVGVSPKVDKDGKLQDAQYFDFTRLELVKGEATIEIKSTKAKGGPNRDCPR